MKGNSWGTWEVTACSCLYHCKGGPEVFQLGGKMPHSSNYSFVHLWLKENNCHFKSWLQIEHVGPGGKLNFISKKRSLFIKHLITATWP